jgi:hypothetical protein
LDDLTREWLYDTAFTTPAQVDGMVYYTLGGESLESLSRNDVPPFRTIDPALLQLGGESTQPTFDIPPPSLFPLATPHLFNQITAAHLPDEPDTPSPAKSSRASRASTSPQPNASAALAAQLVSSPTQAYPTPISPDPQSRPKRRKRGGIQ